MRLMVTTKLTLIFAVAEEQTSVRALSGSIRTMRMYLRWFTSLMGTATHSLKHQPYRRCGASTTTLNLILHLEKYFTFLFTKFKNKSMPGIKEKAMLASVGIGIWTASKHDKKATQDVHDIHGAINAGRFNKHLISKNHLRDLQALVSEIRKFHTDNTLPWGKRGERLLPSDNYMKYTSKMSYYRSEFD